MDNLSISDLLGGDDFKEKPKKANNNKIKEEMDNLYNEINYHADLYYNKDEPEISDYEYDMLLNKLKEYERKYPEFKRKDSMTSNVGGTVGTNFAKVVHKVPLQSLQDVFSYDEIIDFDNRVKKALEKEKVEYVVETKIDGLSSSIEYDNGKFVLGATRGDGITGEDVTENFKKIKKLPKEIEYKEDLILRGEVYISKKDFEKLNIQQEEDGLKTFANARNAAARFFKAKRF